MASLALKGVTKNYGKSVAVRDFSLHVEDREFVVLVGPSGCGKTTVLRMIAGLTDVTSGEIFIDNRLVNDLPPRNRDIAMVFQSYALYPNMTVYENMAFGLKMRRVDKKAIEEKVRAAARMLDIERYLDRKPAKLSGGERQRVAIGRALVRNPKAFLMDEPLSNLDAKLRNAMRAEIIKLHKSLQATFLYVTHDQVEAMTLGDRIVVMRDGRIQQVDAPEKVYDKPANKYVAEFIGSPPMNFLPAVLVKSGSSCFGRLVGPERLVELPRALRSSAEARALVDREMILGIRPEHVQVCDASEGANLLEMRVEVVERMGAEAHLHLSLGPVRVIAKTEPDRVLRVDERVAVRLPAEKLHVFGAEDERNLLYSSRNVDR